MFQRGRWGGLWVTKELKTNLIWAAIKKMQCLCSVGGNPYLCAREALRLEAKILVAPYMAAAVHSSGRVRDRYWQNKAAINVLPTKHPNKQKMLRVLHASTSNKSCNCCNYAVHAQKEKHTSDKHQKMKSRGGKETGVLMPSQPWQLYQGKK